MDFRRFNLVEPIKVELANKTIEVIVSKVGWDDLVFESLLVYDKDELAMSIPTDYAGILRILD